MYIAGPEHTTTQHHTCMQSNNNNNNNTSYINKYNTLASAAGLETDCK